MGDQYGPDVKTQVTVDYDKRSNRTILDLMHTTIDLTTVITII